MKKLSIKLKKKLYKKGRWDLHTPYIMPLKYKNIQHINKIHPPRDTITTNYKSQNPTNQPISIKINHTLVWGDESYQRSSYASTLHYHQILHSSQNYCI